MSRTRSLTPREYTICGAMTGAAFGLLTGLLLPATFLATLKESSPIHARSLGVIVAVISMVYLPASVAIGGWIGCHVGEATNADPSFRFGKVVWSLVRGLLEQKAYRMLLALTLLFLLGGGAYKIYLLCQ